MKNSKKNYRLFFNLLLMGGMLLFFSSCARERGVVSYKSEKLRKESFEIENSRTSGKFDTKAEENNSNPSVSEELNTKKGNVVSEYKTSKKGASEVKTSKEEKLNPVEKILIKKMNKKLEAKKKSARLDQNLRMAIIFGAIAVIFFILEGLIPFFWIFGAIALVVAIIFLLLWVLEQ